MNPATPGARWSPALHSRRPYIGQAQAPATTDVLTVGVNKDGKPFAGAAVEIMFMNGDASNGVTDSSGRFSVPYTAAQKGQAIVRITPPADIEDLGEGSTQGVDLKGGPVSVKFDLVGVGGSPLVGVGIVGALYGLVLAVL